MTPKKAVHANLERSRGLARQMGLILAFGFIFIAFEYTNADVIAHDLDFTNEVFVEPDYVPITKEKEFLPPPPPPIMIFDLLTVVDNSYDIPDDIEITNIEDYDVTILDFTDEVEVDPDVIFFHVENQPEFPGGYKALMQYLSRNIRYPSLEQEMGISGKVYISFVVNKNGSIVDVEVMKGVNESLNAEAMRVIKQMPNWKPGKQGGKNVRVSYRIPIHFALK